MNTDELYHLFLQYPSVETDTRKLKKGDIFFALKGPNFNGNHYLQQALDMGAAYCVADEATVIDSDRIIQVDDSLVALQQLAKKHRMQFQIPFIAITGSNGKTTTKELVSEVLSSSYKTSTTYGNLNNHIGVPLTILSIAKDAEMAVIEMGANHQKEIASYCEYTMPTHGLITNCGKAHLEGFGGEEGVKKGKGELFDYLRAHRGIAFIYNDYDYLHTLSAGIQQLVTYGEKTGDITGEVKADNGFLEVAVTKGAALPSIKTQLVGGYNLPNILAAVCIGKTFKVNDDKIKIALESYEPSNSRSQLLNKGTNKIILDAYNANPTSMKAAINNFSHMDGDKKVLILGGMMELGESSIAEHAEIVKLIESGQWYKVVLVGKDYLDLPSNIFHFSDAAGARDWFRNEGLENAQILVKGSRSMQMEKVIAW
ncbi:MAG: UDP-N-acetylmuramoyl-tripeptide--D-alanyl-D-alanine ligase [Chitinophagaceae bacterium]|nr:MAG: UDP-N-acetylmuramoyl-tripeptide--D-alanyl-D-alanine ligase [Chitinophagaceae bacterium]